MTFYISNTDLYKEVISQVQSVKHMLWIGTADIKDLYLDVGNEKKPFLALIAQLIRCGVEVRLIHAKNLAKPMTCFRSVQKGCKNSCKNFILHALRIWSS